MADNADVVEPLDPAYEEKVERLAQKLLRGTDDNGLAAGDIDSARRMARRMLEESEARTNEGYNLEPEDDHVIRRSSSETAAVGDTGTFRTVSDGD